MALEWIFERRPDYGGIKGGLASSEVFRSTLETLVRESLQNCRDQRLKADHGDGRARVRFTLEEISGQALEEFLEAVQWETLREHIQGSARPEYTEIGPKLIRGLERLNSEHTLRLLRIEDFETKGLNGGEIAEGKGNFDSLVRSEMINDPERKDSGGSYGLGKSVYWTFSELSTVIFSSVPSEGPEPLLIGRCDLASHATGEDLKWAGPGFFGIRDLAVEEGVRRAISLRGPDALERAGELGFERQSSQTGTSIMIVGFDDPSLEDEPDVLRTCQGLIDETVRWYWPALLEGSLEVQVVGNVDGEEIFNEEASAEVDALTADVRPFVEAFLARHEAEDVLPAELEPGQTGRQEVALTVPQRNDGTAPEQQGTATLLARRTTEEEAEDAATAERTAQVALMRGAAMVVEYRDSKGDFDGHAVLLAGKAKEDFDDTDESIDEFVRACEPPAHDRWEHDTNRARKDYASTKGGRATARSALGKLWAELKSLLTVEEKVAPSSGTEGPPELRQRFPLGGRDLSDETPKRFILRASPAETTDRYRIAGSFERTSSAPLGGWAFTVAMTVAEEGGSSKEPIPIEKLETEIPETTIERLDSNRFRVEVPAEVGKVAFRVETPTDPLPGTDLRTVWPRLQVSESS